MRIEHSMPVKNHKKIIIKKLSVISRPVYRSKSPIIPIQKIFRRPFLSAIGGSQSSVTHQPMNSDAPIKPIFQSSTHVRSSFCCQLSNVLSLDGSASQLAIYGSPSQMLSLEQTSAGRVLPSASLQMYWSGYCVKKPTS